MNIKPKRTHNKKAIIANFLMEERENGKKSKNKLYSK